jgi:hypothetical protein
LWKLDHRKPERGGFPHPVVKTCETCQWNKDGYCKIAAESIATVEGCPRPNFEDDLSLALKVIKRTGEENLFNRKILGVEKEFDEIIDGVRIKGVIDLVTEIDKDTLEITDYKTGKNKKTSATIVKDPQVRIYKVVAKKLWPEYKYHLLTLDYLRSKPISVTFSDEDDELTIKSIHRHHDDIVETVDPTPLPYAGWLCPFCIGWDRCTKLYDKFKEKGKFKLPVITCEYNNPSCWGGMSVIEPESITDEGITKIKYACAGHKEIPNGGSFIAEVKIAPVEETDRD